MLRAQLHIHIALVYLLVAYNVDSKLFFRKSPAFTAGFFIISIPLYPALTYK